LLYRFGNCVLDEDRRELRRGTALVSVEPQVFDILSYLIRNRERVVSRDDLIVSIWAGRIVSESALTTRINAARSAIGDNGQDQSLIKTLPRKGFRFVGTVHEYQSQSGRATAEASDVQPVPALALPGRASIAVLPFTNMSGDPEQDYFADGMTEEVITALSRCKWLFVIARNSSFTYKGKTVDVRQVGRELGVRYVLEGSVRKSGNRVRITGQLIEAGTGSHLWADKFDGSLEDVFDLQDQVAASVVGLIAPKLELAEIERARQKPTERLDSYDFYLRGMSLLYQRAPVLEAQKLFKRAIEQDPQYAAAYAMAAWMSVRQQADAGLPLTAETRTEAIDLARQGAKLANSDDAFTLARCSHVLTYLGHEYDRGASMVEQAVVLNPNLAIAWYSRGWVTLLCGGAELAIESFDRMLRLSPLEPFRLGAWNGVSFALLFLGRYEEGYTTAMKSLQYVPTVHSLGAYIANSMLAGRPTEAREAVTQLSNLHPDFRASHAQEAFPFRKLEWRNQIAAALRDAGLPD
jgi:adenylate cyclase